jgi:hypothetical protein
LSLFYSCRSSGHGKCIFSRLTARLTYGNALLDTEETIMVTSYGETSGFSALTTEELMLVNGGKGSSSSSSSSSSQKSKAATSSSSNTIYGDTSQMNAVAQVYAQTVTNEYIKATTALVAATKEVSKAAVAITVALFSPPAVSVVYGLLNPGTASHTTLH